MSEFPQPPSAPRLVILPWDRSHGTDEQRRQVPASRNSENAFKQPSDLCGEGVDPLDWTTFTMRCRPRHLRRQPCHPQQHVASSPLVSFYSPTRHSVTSSERGFITWAISMAEMTSVTRNLQANKREGNMRNKRELEVGRSEVCWSFKV